MAGFKTHVTVSTAAGIGYAATAYTMYQLPLPTCILAGGLCSVSGMLPDLDSDTGRPLQESLAFSAAIVATMLVDRFQQFGMSMESIILATAGVYLAVRFGFGALLRAYTVHRGMFHSLPAAAIFGELTFLLAPGDVRVRCYQAGAVVLGYLSHLLLDEIYSVQLGKHGVGLKKSFGTALKLYGNSLWPNVSTYGKLALLTFLAFSEPGWMSHFYQDQIAQPASQFETRLGEFASRYGLKDTKTTTASASAPSPNANAATPESPMTRTTRKSGATSR